MRRKLNQDHPAFRKTVVPSIEPSCRRQSIMFWAGGEAGGGAGEREREEFSKRSARRARRANKCASRGQDFPLALALRLFLHSSRPSTARGRTGRKRDRREREKEQRLNPYQNTFVGDGQADFAEVLRRVLPLSSPAPPVLPERQPPAQGLQLAPLLCAPCPVATARRCPHLRLCLLFDFPPQPASLGYLARVGTDQCRGCARKRPSGCVFIAARRGGENDRALNRVEVQGRG